MNLRAHTKALVHKEKHYTALIIKNLATIERKKLFSDYGYPSLFKYLVRELKYSEGEANIRVAAVKLQLRDRNVATNIQQGDLTLTNAAQIGGALAQHERDTGRKASNKVVQKAIDIGLGKSTRKTKDDLRRELKLSVPRAEKLILDERILGKIDRAKAIYGVDSTYELLDILLEEKLKSPKPPLRYRNVAAKNSRYIPVGVKHSIHKGKCLKCGTRRNLHYDHIKGYALGGDNSAQNIQVLCENCNQRKRIRQLK